MEHYVVPELCITEQCNTFDLLVSCNSLVISFHALKAPAQVKAACFLFKERKAPSSVSPCCHAIVTLSYCSIVFITVLLLSTRSNRSDGGSGVMSVAPAPPPARRKKILAEQRWAKIIVAMATTENEWVVRCQRATHGKSPSSPVLVQLLY